MLRIRRQVQGRLPGRVTAADHECPFPGQSPGLCRRGSVEHAGPGQRFQPGDCEPPVGNTGRDDHGAAGDRASVLEPDDAQIAVDSQRGGRVAVDELRSEHPGLLVGTPG